MLAPAVASYTAVLLSQTAVPAWHEAHTYLPFIFTGSAAAGGLCEIAASRIMERRLGLVGEAFHAGKAGRQRRLAEYLNAAGVLGTLAARRSRVAAVASGLALLAGSVLQRFGTFEAGIASTEDPKYVVVPQRQRLDERRRTEQQSLTEREGAGPAAPH